MDDVNVMIVDDHAMVRSALASRLEQEPDLHVIAEAKDAGVALEIAEEKRPDVLLLDIDMPGPACFEAARLLSQRSPGTKVIFLSAFFNDHYVEQALEVRARGYLTKRDPHEALVHAIREVARGGVFFSDDVRKRLVFEKDGVHLDTRPKTRVSKLTKREVEVLRYLARGMSKKDIAEVLDRSVKTVDNHCVNLMAKLDIHDRVELARFAIREGLAEA